MSLELIINSTNEGVDAALLKDQKLIELHQEKGSSDFQVGDIYLAKVRKTVPSLNAAFVDVGYEKDAFLHYLDLGPQFKSQTKFIKGIANGKFKDFMLSNFKLDADIDKNGKIGDVLSSSQLVLVQIAKEPISSKGPRLSSEVTLAGRYIVLVPFSNKISVSQKIKDSEERDRLKRLISSIKPQNFGVIIRTVAEDRKVAELDQDLRELVDRWKEMCGSINKSGLPNKVLGEIDRTSSILRDMLNENFTNIHVDDPKLTQELKSYVSTIAPGKESIIKPYKGRLNIFDQFGVHRQIKASFGRKIMMPSGAYLIIDHTEAMHVVDVNSGNRKAGQLSQEENVLAVNMEAATELARILRLRDMGGIIAVDFIDLSSREHNKQLLDHLRKEMKADRAKHTILPPSKFGVVEITRQRVRPETEIDTRETCPVCNGTGKSRASILILDEIENNLRFIAEKRKGQQILLRTHPFIAAYLTKGFKSIRKKWSKQHKLKLQVLSVEKYHFMEYNFYDKDDNLLEE